MSAPRSSLPARLAAVLLLCTLPHRALAAAPFALFDNTHAETAGNADWIIDTDQPVPLPAQSGIGPTTPGTYWLGAISTWGVDLAKRGYTVATLTSTYGITYGNASNPYDLSKVDVFIVDEPNTRFSAAEATAILDFVRNGGGLVAVSDHWQSDRNNDGWDSPMIWNDMDPGHLLGVHFAVSGDANNNIVQTSSNVNPSPSDSVTQGSIGSVGSLAFHNGSTMTLYPAVNPTIRGEVWMTGVAQTSTTSVMAASAVYGNGRVFFVGDSSPCDDGSAQPGNTSIFDGWAEATDSTLFLNATLWVTRRAGDTTPPAVTLLSPTGGETWKAGSSHAIQWSASDGVGVTGVDLAWSSDNGASFPNAIATGVANTGSFGWTVPDAPGSSLRVRVIARDAAGNAARDSSAAFTIDRWTITASAGPGGSVSPSGAIGVVEGASQTITISPDPGRAILDVVVDAVSAGAVPSVTFSAVSANHTLQASFRDATAPGVTLTFPDGGERWDMGSVHSIQWSASDDVGVDSINVDLSLSGLAGPWTPVAHGLANSGSYAWTVPATPTDSAYIRVTAYDAALNTAVARSDSAFHIVDPNVGVENAGPRVLALARPQPNPGHDPVTLRFSLPTAGAATLEILDPSGRRVWSDSASRPPGDQTLRWAGRTSTGAMAQPGLYFVRLITPWGTRTQRLAWLR